MAKQTYPIVATAAQTSAGLRGINREMRLYLIPSGSGFSCLGFDVLQRKTANVAAWLGRPDLAPPARKGTLKAWRAYQTAMAAGATHSRTTGKRCEAELTRLLSGFEGRRVQVIQPDGERRRFIVGKSGGWMPCHIEIANRRSHGGPAAYIPKGSQISVIA